MGCAHFTGGFCIGSKYLYLLLDGGMTNNGQVWYKLSVVVGFL